MKKLVMLAAAAVALPLATRDALAQNPNINTMPGDRFAPATTNRDYVKNPTGVSVGGMLGNGFSDAFGIGFGARGGYTFENRIYVGGAANYHFGTTTEALGVRTNPSVWHFGPEAGYDMGVGPVIVRPVVGLGLAFRTDRVSVNGSAESNTAVHGYLAPGASVIFPIMNYFVGGDSRVMVMGGGTPTAVTLFGTAGVHL